MVSVNTIAYAALKKLDNLVSKQSLDLQIIADVRKVMKNAQCNLTFIFTEFSEKHNIFV